MKKFTTTEVGKMLGVSRFAMDGILEREEIDYVVIGKRRFITQEQFDAYVNNMVHTKGSKAENKGVVDKVNDELKSMGAMAMTAREELLIEALGRALGGRYGD